MIDNTEYLILKNLISDNQYSQKVLPFLKREYFNEINGSRDFFDMASGYILKYGNLPTLEAMTVTLSNSSLPENQYNNVKELINKLGSDNSKKPDHDWLVNTTEEFCKRVALYDAILTCGEIIQGSNKKISKTAMPQMLADALAISFDSNIGYDLFEDYKVRYADETDDERRFKFDIDILNQITNGGLKPKTLNVFVAGVHVGKTMLMCHLAKNWVLNGYNVLYLTLEMSEEEIGERIIANMLDIRIKDLAILKKKKKEEYFSRMEKAKRRFDSHVIVKQFPTSNASVINFNAIVQELKIKKNFKPDIVLVDYINIVAPAQYKSTDNMYSRIKTISEELRAFAVMNDLPVFSATQFNREGQRSNNPDMTDVAESSGLPATVDLLLAGNSTPELRESNQLRIIQFKNRYGDLNENKSFFIGADYSKGRFMNTDQQMMTYDEPDYRDEVTPQIIPEKRKNSRIGW